MLCTVLPPSTSSQLTFGSQNPTTRAEIATLSPEELAKRFSSRIAFGTAGLRGPMQAGASPLPSRGIAPRPDLAEPLFPSSNPGPSAMNDVTILQASQGLAQYAESQDSGAKARGIVVGHDHRHNSSEFGRLTAGVFRWRGWKVYELDGLVHTPIVVRPFLASFWEGKLTGPFFLLDSLLRRSGTALSWVL